MKLFIASNKMYSNCKNMENFSEILSEVEMFTILKSLKNNDSEISPYYDAYLLDENHPALSVLAQNNAIMLKEMGETSLESSNQIVVILKLEDLNKIRSEVLGDYNKWFSKKHILLIAYLNQAKINEDLEYFNLLGIDPVFITKEDVQYKWENF